MILSGSDNLAGTPVSENLKHLEKGFRCKATPAVAIRKAIVINRGRISLFILFAAFLACFGADGVRHAARHMVKDIRWVDLKQFTSNLSEFGF